MILKSENLAYLWGRIRNLILFHITARIDAKNPGCLMVSTESGTLMADLGLEVKQKGGTYLTASLESEDAQYRAMSSHYVVMVAISGPDLVSGLESILVDLNAERVELTRRHYPNASQEKTYVVFGNTKYTGTGCPKLNSQADTGEPCMVFAVGKTLVLCLPDREAREVRVWNRNSVIRMYGEPEEEEDLIPLGYYEKTMPMHAGTGSGAVLQSDRCSAEGELSFAANRGSANGQYAFAANDGTAGGLASTAFGSGNAPGTNALAIGMDTEAKGTASFAEGYGNTASGLYSHAAGAGTVAAGTGQFVFGKYNVEDADSVYAEMVGNGNSQARSNARTLDWNGNEVLAGQLESSGLIRRDGEKRYRLFMENGQLVCREI